VGKPGAKIGLATKRARNKKIGPPPGKEALDGEEIKCEKHRLGQHHDLISALFNNRVPATPPDQEVNTSTKANLMRQGGSAQRSVTAQYTGMDTIKGPASSKRNGRKGL